MRIIEDREDPAETQALDSADRILRGGAFDSPRPLTVRSDHRFQATPSDRTHMVGYRVARTIREPPAEAPQQPAGEPRENAIREP